MLPPGQDALATRRFFLRGLAGALAASVVSRGRVWADARQERRRAAAGEYHRNLPLVR